MELTELEHELHDISMKLPVLADDVQLFTPPKPIEYSTEDCVQLIDAGTTKIENRLNLLCLDDLSQESSSETLEPALNEYDDLD